MDELDKIEEYLKNNDYTYKRQPVFAGMPKGPEQISVYEESWNVICDGGALEYSGPLFDVATGGLTAVKLIKEIEKI